MNTIERSIPRQVRGIQKHLSAARKFVTIEDATMCYDHAVGRMLNINQWSLFAPVDKDMFRITDDKRRAQFRKARLDDYVRIGLPAPGNEDGSGYDWVRVKDIKFTNNRQKEQCLLTLRPCPAPGKDTVAHFFSDESSSTFVLTRQERIVTADYYGRNELPNLDTPGARETIRNVAVAAGALAGLSDTMWKPLIEGFLMDGTALRSKQAAKDNR